MEAFGKDFATLKPNDPLWPSNPGSGRGITSGSFYGNVRRYIKAARLWPPGVHILGHSAAKLRRAAGDPVEQRSRFPDHSSLAVTSLYLTRLEGHLG